MKRVRASRDWNTISQAIAFHIEDQGMEPQTLRGLAAYLEAAGHEQRQIDVVRDAARRFERGR